MYIIVSCTLGFFPKFESVVFSFSGAALVYAINRYLEAKIETFGPTIERATFILERKPKIQIIILSYFLLVLVSALHISSALIYWIFPLIFVAWIYSYPKGPYLKRYVLVKNALPSFGLAVNAILPVVYSADFLTTDMEEGLAFLFSFIFIKMVFNTAFYDLKDVEVDKRNRVQTLPVLIGRKTTVRVLYLSELIYTTLTSFLLLILPPMSWTLRFLTVLWASLIYDILYIWFYEKNILPNKLIFGVIGDSAFIFLGILSFVLLAGGL